MVDGVPKGFGYGGPSASSAEIEALSEIIAATIGMAMRAQSEAATVLLERALAALQARFAPEAALNAGGPGEDGPCGSFSRS